MRGLCVAILVAVPMGICVTRYYFCHSSRRNGYSGLWLKWPLRLRCQRLTGRVWEKGSRLTGRLVNIMIAELSSTSDSEYVYV